MNKYKFFLGGNDAEMRRIAEILTETSIDYVDAGLGWGAKASSYGPEAFSRASEDGFAPVLVELDLDCGLPLGAIVIDHHGECAGNPPALVQMAELIGHELSRWDRIVAANDSGWYPGLMGWVEVPGLGRLDPPASPEELRAIRGSEASLPRMAHSKTGLVGDRLAIAAIEAGATSPADFPAYLVLSGDGEANFSGDGVTAAALHSAFPGGWAGGAGLGQAGGNAYWGGHPPHGDVISFLTDRSRSV